MARVLVVDDEPDHRLTLQAILQRSAAVEVVTAAGADEALQAARAAHFSVAVVDLRLPGRDGLSIMHALRQAQPWIEVVILTAYPSPVTCRVALTEGAAAYLEKPFSPDALRSLVDALIAKGSPPGETDSPATPPD